MVCECYDFCFDLVKIGKDILVKEDEKLQWKMFKQFLVDYTKLMSSLQEYVPDKSAFCTIQICSVLLNKLVKFRRYYRSLSTFFVDVITFLHFERCMSRHWKRITAFSSKLKTLRGLFALQSYDSAYMKLMLNLGLLSSLPADSPHLLNELKHEISMFLWYEGFYTHDGVLHEDPSDTVLDSITEQAIQLVQSSFFCDEDKQNHKRMFLAMIAINAIPGNLKEDYFSNAENGISCLRIYFAATRDAILSVSEARSVLYACFKLINKLHLFETYCEEFNKLMPECPTKMQPRTLTHLARSQVRENLSVSLLPLPSAVDKLFLPKILKKYILGEIDDISHDHKANIRE